MNHFKFYVGIDVSKDWLDVAVFVPNEGVVHQVKIDNSTKPIGMLFKTLKKQFSGKTEEFFYCLEHTGKYCLAFLEVATRIGAKVWLELPIQIKRRQGLVRGKTDQWDAERIAEYAYRFEDKAVFWEPTDKTIQKLKDLQVKRAQLVKVHSQLIQEDKLDPLFKKPIAALKQAINAIEAKLDQVLAENEEFNHQSELLRSIPGVGKQTALALIIATRGFTRLTDTRKLSCYAGVAPFPYSSGTSVKGRTKISQMGDMKLKVLLNLSAWNAIRSIRSLKEYYQRKVLEGKHKLSVINAIRNKIIAMALAVIKRDSAFRPEYNVNLTC